jgi:hypothetical protein
MSHPFLIVYSKRDDVVASDMHQPDLAQLNSPGLEPQCVPMILLGRVKVILAASTV